MQAPIPVTVVTGFLGAGKTSRLARWLAEFAREEVAVIVNEEGEIGIDGALLAQRAERLREIAGGCICCVTQAALDAALVHFARAAPRPGRILVETSGAASPAGVIRVLTMGSARGELRLDGVITVLDASRAHETLEWDLAAEQLAFADVVVTSHLDRCAPGTIEALERELAERAPGAVLARSRRGPEGVQMPALRELLAQRAGASTLVDIPSTSGAGHGFDALALMHEGELDEARFGDWVERELGPLQARIARVKGILAVRGVEARVLVQGVGESIEISVLDRGEAQARVSRLIVIGLGLREVEDDLRAGFEACAASLL